MSKNDKLLTTKEVAETLSLNNITIYSYIKSGILSAVKFGRNYRIEKTELSKFIKNHKMKKGI